MKPVLMYHSVDDGRGTYPQTRFHRNKYTVLETMLRRHLDAIHEVDVEITFDDGHRSIWDSGIHRWDASHAVIVFVTTGMVGSPDWLTKSHIREMAQAGVLFGIHGEAHIPATSIPLSEFTRQSQNAKAFLEDILGARVTLGSLVGGAGDRSVIRCLKDLGIEAVYTSAPGVGVTPLGGIKRQWMLRDTGVDEVERLVRGWVQPSVMARYHTLEPLKRMRRAWRKWKRS